MYRNFKKIFPFAISLLFLAALFAIPGEAQQDKTSSNTGDASSHDKKASASKTKPSNQRQKSPAPQVVHLARFAESAPARTFPSAERPLANTRPGLPPEIESPEAEGREINPLNTARGRVELPGPSYDGALQSALRPTNVNRPAALPAPSLTFEGIAAGNSAPPDTNGDVGPRDYVQTVNTIVGIWDKSGVPRGSSFKQSSLFAALGGICSRVDDGDPVVLYDRIADRWLISQFSFTSSTTPPYHECIAISQTPDPTGVYFLYDFVVPGTEFPDYPKFGVWPDGYYMTTNQFNNGGPFDGVGAFVFDRQKMLVGDPTAGSIYFNLNLASHSEGIFGMLPSDHDGLLPPPAGPRMCSFISPILISAIRRMACGFSISMRTSLCRPVRLLLNEAKALTPCLCRSLRLTPVFLVDAHMWSSRRPRGITQQIVWIRWRADDVPAAIYQSQWG